MNQGGRANYRLSSLRKWFLFLLQVSSHQLAQCVQDTEGHRGILPRVYNGFIMEFESRKSPSDVLIWREQQIFVP